MKNATLAQGNQVINLILQKEMPASQLQALIESGLLSDILDANVEHVDREKFREVIGLKKPGEKVRTHRFVIRNLSPSQELVEEEVEAELGDVNIVDWYIEDTTNYDDGFVVGGGMMPQRNITVVVKYTEK